MGLVRRVILIKETMTSPGVRRIYRWATHVKLLSLVGKISLLSSDQNSRRPVKKIDSTKNVNQHSVMLSEETHFVDTKKQVRNALLLNNLNRTC
jgi:hypothetical protein